MVNGKKRERHSGVNISGIVGHKHGRIECEGESRGEAVASMVVLFAEPKHDFPSEQMMWARNKLVENGGVKVRKKWCDDVTHVAASAFTSFKELADLTDDILTEDSAGTGVSVPQLLLPSEVLDLCNRPKGWSVDEWFQRSNSDSGPWLIARKQVVATQTTKNAVRGVNTESANRHSTLETREQLLNRIPDSRRAACVRFLDSSDKYGIKAPEQIVGLARLPPGSSPDISFTKAYKDNHLVAADLNPLITFWLNAGYEYYHVMQDQDQNNQWRSKMMKMQCDKVRSLPIKIERMSDLEPYIEILDISKPTLRKIEEVLEKGYIAKYKAFTEMPLFVVKQELTKLYGIGPNKAVELFEKGFKTIESLRCAEGYAALSRSSCVALRVYNELQQRIPRDEVVEIRNYVQAAADELWSNNLNVEAAGSFRRGKIDCGDVDLICTTRYESDKRTPPIQLLIDKLIKSGFIVDLLQNMDKPKIVAAASRELVDEVQQQCYCICRLPGATDKGGKRLARRLDIKFYRRDAYPFALIYFTGNEHYNRLLRWYCQKHGFSLSDTGLYVAVGRHTNDQNRQRCEVNILSKCKTERDVLTAIGFPYMEPSQRNSIDGKTAKIASSKTWLGDASVITTRDAHWQP